jgi:hypothetical protein
MFWEDLENFIIKKRKNRHWSTVLLVKKEVCVVTEDGRILISSLIVCF